jgi:hypothetical protein
MLYVARSFNPEPIRRHGYSLLNACYLPKPHSNATLAESIVDSPKIDGAVNLAGTSESWFCCIQ